MLTPHSLLAQSAPPLPEWLLHLLSIDTEALEGGTGHVRFARFPEGGMGLLVILLILAGMGFIVWMYRREGSLTRGRKLLFAGIRCILLFCLAIVLFYPVLEIDRMQQIQATTVVLVDDSLSQGIKDRYLSSQTLREATAKALELDPNEVPTLTRAQLVEHALSRREWDILGALSERNRLKVYAFSRLPLKPLPWTPIAPITSRAGTGTGTESDGDRQNAKNETPLESPEMSPGRAVAIEPAGETTNLAGALRSAVELEAGTRLAGVVVLSDGRVTAGEDLKGIASFLREKNIPVYTVGVGDPAPTRNLRINAVLTTERVFVGDPIVVDVRVEHKGFAGETVRIELVDEQQPPEGPPLAPVVVGTVDLEFSEESPESTANFQFQPKDLGDHRLTARIEPHAEETFSDDNERSARFQVVAEASKVLLISGGPSYEYRYLKNLLRRDSRITLAAWLMSADVDYPQEGNVILKKLPAAAKELFEYDVVILMDVDPSGMPPELPKLLEEFVAAHHGGLAVVGGDKFSIAMVESPAAAPIRDLLPVAIDSGEVRDELEQGRYYEREWTPLPTPAASRHAATRLSSQEDRNRDRWAEIAAFFWSFPARKAKPGATVVFEHPDPALIREGHRRPLLVTQYYGGGRVMWLGIDSSWRWRSRAEEVYDRFWIQSARFLTEGRLLQAKRQLVQTDRDTYDFGETVALTAHLLDDNYRPVDVDEQAIMIEDPDGMTVSRTLLKDAAAPGWYRGIFTPRSLGTHKISLGGDTPNGGAAHQFDVAPPRLEFQEPQLDEEALRELALSTLGSYVRLPDLPQVPERIPDRRQTVLTSDEPIPLWDNWFCLSLLVGLLSVEWILRKLHRLL